MEKQWNVGDMCFYEYELSQIKRVEHGHVKSITTGYIESSGSYFNDRCFPVTLGIKLISDHVESWSKRFHAIKMNINHPDLHRKLVNYWINMCLVAEDRKNLDVRRNEFDSFCESVMVKIREAERINVGEFNLFR